MRTSSPSTPEGKLGRYEMLRHLASGGMADVMLARATGIEGFERYVVLKRIRVDLARDRQFINMFLDEARLAATLHHQNVVQVHDIGQEEGEYFFTMEYLHGEDLRTLLKRVSSAKQKVPLEHVITIVSAAAAGLHYAHEQRDSNRKPLGIVHRDVSPSNIMIGYDGSIKVTDFGIAKATVRSAQTETGSRKGKLAYMSPEQCLGKKIDRRSDVFSLGITLWELTTARRLFKGDSDFVVMNAIVNATVPSPTNLRPDLPPALEAIIMKAMARKPSDRYQSTDEMRAALRQFATEAKLSTSSDAVSDYLKLLFGERPEPWLVDAVPQLELEVDFDGSQSPIVEVEIASLEDEFKSPDSDSIQPDSPIARARKKAITESPPLALAPPEAGEATVLDAQPIESSGPVHTPPNPAIAPPATAAPAPPAPAILSPSIASPGPAAPAAPVAFESDDDELVPARRAFPLRIVGLGVAAGALLIVLVVVFGGSNTDQTAKREAATPSAEIPTPTEVAPTTPTTPPTPPTPTPAATAVVADPVEQPAVVQTPDKPAAVKPKPKATTPKPKPTTDTKPSLRPGLLPPSETKPKNKGLLPPT